MAPTTPARHITHPIELHAVWGQLGNISTAAQWLSVSSCDQDLKEKYALNLTKLDFTVWNSAETPYTGSYACVDSVNTVPLDSANQNPAAPIVVQATNFDFATVGTPNARFQVDGLSRTPPCPNPTQNVGLVAVYNTWVGIDGDIPGIDQDIGNTSQGAGTEAGFVLWDVTKSVPPAPSK